MPARVIQIEEVPYRVFVNRERNGYRAFWFCPHSDCFGAFRRDQLCANREDALKVGVEAAHEHEFKSHHNIRSAIALEASYEARTGIAIHG